MAFSKDIYAVRRARVAELIGDDGIALIPTGHEALRNGDVHYPFRPSSSCYYLTGFSEPDAILVIMGGVSPKSVLFCNSKDPAMETWTGFRFGPERAQTDFGFDEAYPLGVFEPKFRELARGIHKYYSVGAKENWDSQITSAFMNVISEPLNSREGKNISPFLDSMRIIKDSAEAHVMKKACAISSDAHRKVMQMCAPGMVEYELEAAINCEFRSHGGDSLHAYPTIVAGGNNACTLHYTENSDSLHDGDLVLIDAGCELDCYASDITRTFPVNGKFSSAQRALYEIVLASQLAAIEVIRPGITYGDLQRTGWEVLAAGLVDLGILFGDSKEIVQSGEHMPFTLHAIGHFLGHDVHDVGMPYGDRNARSALVLKMGMVLTAEPGIYIPKGMMSVDPKWHGIGIRIEDDVLVTADGHEAISNAPKTVEEIESLMCK